MPWLNPGLISALTPAALVMLGFLFMMLGLLVPRWVVKGIAEDRDERLVTGERREAEWREAYLAERSAREKNEESLREALEVARTASAALAGVRTAVTLMGSETPPQPPDRSGL